jgi:hypothetical protein
VVHILFNRSMCVRLLPDAGIQLRDHVAQRAALLPEEKVLWDALEGAVQA